MQLKTYCQVMAKTCALQAELCSAIDEEEAFNGRHTVAVAEMKDILAALSTFAGIIRKEDVD